jgi:hypothetical protein
MDGAVVVTDDARALVDELAFTRRAVTQLLTARAYDAVEGVGVTEPTIRVRQAEEPFGRWEGRCHANLATRSNVTLASVCDRPYGHKGLHSGRRFDLRTGEVVAYVRWAA